MEVFWHVCRVCVCVCVCVPCVCVCVRARGCTNLILVRALGWGTRNVIVSQVSLQRADRESDGLFLVRDSVWFSEINAAEKEKGK